jgi:predicted regulator of Ras-like GTPase activity (Roadblock/LC7/MglB family)
VNVPGRPGQDLNWLITNFVERVPEVAHAVAVSSDGLPLAYSDGFPQERADQLAAVTAVEMQAGVLLIMAISNGASLAVLTSSTADLGLIAYEMALLVERAGKMMTPAPRRANHVAAAGNGNGR